MDSQKLQPDHQDTSQCPQQARGEHFGRVLRILEIIQFDNHYGLVIIIHFIKLASVFHMVVAYLLLSAQPVAIQTKGLVNSFLQNLVAYRALQTSAYFLKVVKILAMVVAFRSDRNSLAWGISKKFLRFVIPISQADLFIASILLLLSFQENIFPFLVSCGINIGLSILGGNFVNRKLESYQSSQSGSLIYKFLQITLLLGNSGMLAIGIPTYYFIFNLSVSVAVIAWYSDIGIRLYIHQIPKFTTMVYVTLHMAFIALLAEKLILNTNIFAQANIGRFLLIVPFTFSYFYWSDMRRRFRTNILEGGSKVIWKQMKEVDLEYHQLLAQSNNDNEIDSFLVGVFELHRKRKCTNPMCYSFQTTCYDPLLRASVQTSKEIKEKQSILRFHIKCLYEQATSCSQDTTLLLDYVQFLLQSSFDLFLLSRLFGKIQLRELSMLDKIRLSKLKLDARKEGVKVSQSIFEGILEIEDVMVAELTFYSICKDVSVYLKENLEVWKTISGSDINITALRKNLKANLVILDGINEKWSRIARYLPLQKYWRVYYQNYCLFILNQKKHQKNVEDLEIAEEEQLKECAHLEPEGAKDLLLNRSFLFDKSTMYLHTYLFDRVSYVIRVNEAFQKTTGYAEEEIRGLELREVLPTLIKHSHDQSLLNWLEKGESNNYEQYPIRFTELKAKDGSHVPVVKYFKIIVNLHARTEHFLEFVCMLKLNTAELSFGKEEQAKAITNSIVTADGVNLNFLEKQAKFILKSQNNPFIKQQNLQPVETMDEVGQIKRGLRVLVVVLLLMTVGLLSLTTENANALNDYSLQYINFLNLYRYPMAFGKNVLKVFLNVGNQTKAVNQIHLEVTQISQLLADPMTIQSIFDEGLNQPKMYYPFLNNSYNQGIGYNQIDLIYFITSCIQSLNILPANRTGEYFTNFNMYIAPAYDNLINSTKIRFHQSFSAIFTSMLDHQYVAMSLEVAVFAVAAAYIAAAVWRYFRKSRESLRIIIEFGEEEVGRIVFYCRRVRIFFASFSHEDESEEIRMVRQLNQIQLTEDHLLEARKNRREIMNKRSKNIYQCPKESRRWIAYIALLGCLMLIVLAAIVSFEAVGMPTIGELRDFEEDGFYFLRHFPATSVLGHAILERYYNQQFPRQINFYPERYADSISDLTLIGHADYIGNLDLPDSQYFQDRKNYLFGNPCASNPSVLVAAETAMSKCLTIYNRTFSQGITTFLRACQGQVNDFLNKRINLTAAQVDELTVTLTLVAYYITDAIMEWSAEFTGMIAVFNWSNQVLCAIICCFLLALHLIACECIVFPRLEQDFAAMRRMFIQMVPEEILINEKVVRQKFVINGILRQE